MSTKQRLLDSIYITRKSRIEAADRLKQFDNWISNINIYYSAILIVFSICTITNGNEYVNISLVSSSILVFAFNTFAVSQNFKDKYLGYKQNYIALDSLYRKIDTDNNIDDEILSSFNEQYIELLSNCQNHTTLDYYKVIISDKSLMGKKAYTKKKIFSIYAYYIYHKIKTLVIIACSIIAPFVVPVIISNISNMFTNI